MPGAWTQLSTLQAAYGSLQAWLKDRSVQSRAVVREEKAIGIAGHAAIVLLFPAQLRSGPHTVLHSSEFAMQGL